MSQPNPALIFRLEGGISIGVDTCDNCLVKPVISDGTEKVWTPTFRFVNGKPMALFRNGDFTAVAEGNKVVAQRTLGVPPPPPFEWEVRRPDPRVPTGPVLVINPADGRVWTLSNDDPKTQVELLPDRGAEGRASQLFELIFKFANN